MTGVNTIIFKAFRHLLYSQLGYIKSWSCCPGLIYCSRAPVAFFISVRFEKKRMNESMNE